MRKLWWKLGYYWRTRNDKDRWFIYMRFAKCGCVWTSDSGRDGPFPGLGRFPTSCPKHGKVSQPEGLGEVKGEQE